MILSKFRREHMNVEPGSGSIDIIRFESETHARLVNGF